MNPLVAGNGSYIVRPCGHDLHGPTNITKTASRKLWYSCNENTVSFQNDKVSIKSAKR